MKEIKEEREERVVNGYRYLLGCQIFFKQLHGLLAQSAGSVEYTNCFPAEVQNSLNECPVHDTKESDCEVLVMQGFRGIWSPPFITQVHSKHVIVSYLLVK